MSDYKQVYQLWLDKAVDPDVRQGLLNMSEEDIKNAFSSALTFGTAGLRGKMSPGIHRMNVYTVYKASEGVARYMKAHGFKSCALTYDSRLNSELFCHVTSATLASHGIQTYITKECMPTPFLSFMVRHLHCDLGINITASHNPSIYNGYKVYDGNGCQLTDAAANEVTKHIEGVDMFERPLPNFADYVGGNIRFVDDTVEQAYVQCVLDETLSNANGLNVVYTPLNGAGHRIVPHVLKTIEVDNLYTVSEQSYPDGRFETCPYPNPEKAEALALAIKLAEQKHADIVIATDPDSDRLGVAVAHNGKLTRISGNEVGVLLTDYILSFRKQHGGLPCGALVVKTIVTTNMIDAIAKDYGADVVNVLTGFKYIGDVIYKLEQKGEQNRYMFGFEESCGYLKGTYVRDKDGVIASVLIAECAALYKRQGLTLIDRLNQLYSKYGNYIMDTVSYRFEGVEGKQIKQQLLDELRSSPLKSIAGVEVTAYCDFLTQTKYDLPQADVMRFNCADGSQLIVRPSGTEPLIKCYITTVGDKQKSEKRLADIEQELDKMFAK